VGHKRDILHLEGSGIITRKKKRRRGWGGRDFNSRIVEISQQQELCKRSQGLNKKLRDSRAFEQGCERLHALGHYIPIERIGKRGRQKGKKGFRFQMGRSQTKNKTTP